LQQHLPETLRLQAAFDMTALNSGDENNEVPANLWYDLIYNIFPHLNDEARAEIALDLTDDLGKEEREAFLNQLPEHVEVVEKLALKEAALQASQELVAKMQLGFAFYEQYMKLDTAVLRDLVAGEQTARAKKVGKQQEALIKARMAQVAADNADLLLGDNDKLLRAAVSED